MSRVQLCRDYALLGGHFGPKFGGWGHTNVFKDRALQSSHLSGEKQAVTRGHNISVPHLHRFIMGTENQPQYSQELLIMERDQTTAKSLLNLQKTPLEKIFLTCPS